MKKFLLFALVAILGISAQAQGKPEVIKDQPAGSETVYKRVSGKMFTIKSGKINIFDLKTLAENDQPAGDLKVVTAADGKTVYLKYVLSFASYIKDDQAGGWVKGTKEGNKITIPAGQYILYGQFEDGEYGICVGYLELKNGKFEVSNEPITFTLDGITAKLDGTYMEGESQDEKADNKQVVGETYFDLSGRKLSEAGKGIVLKSIKFADGTTKTVKYINK